MPNYVWGDACKMMIQPIQTSVVERISFGVYELVPVLLILELQGISFQPTPKQKQLSILGHRVSVSQMMRILITNTRPPPECDLVSIWTVLIAAMSDHRSGNKVSQNRRLTQ